MFLFRSLTVQTLVLGLWASGVIGACSDQGSPEPDGGPNAGADAGEVERTLEVIGEAAVELGFGETAEIAFLYVDATGVAAADEVTFAIEGRAGDSSLSDVSTFPDETGRVATTLRAGTVGAASFRVRASAPSAANAYVEASVGDAGFGSLAVAAQYRGTREVWGCELRLYTGLACGEIDPAAPPVAGRSVHVGGQMVDGRWEGIFGSLAVGPSYTVLALGLGKGNGVVASGCVPGVLVAADPDPAVEVSVQLDDLPYGARGRFELRSRLDLSVALQGRVADWLRPANALLEGGTETFLLDEVALFLYANAPDEGDGRFAELRDELTRGVAERLAARDADVTAALSSLATDLAASLRAPTLGSELLLDEVVQVEDQAEALRFSHEASELEADLVVAGAEAGVFPITFAQAGLVSLSSGAASTTTDELTIGTHTLPFRIGTLAAAVLDSAVVPELGAGSLAEHLASFLDCGDLGGWIAEQVQGACDAECYRSACEQAAAHLAEAVDQGLRGGDVDYGALTLQGHAHLSDSNGDAATDTLDAGVWTALLTGSLEAQIPAEFDGERVDIE